jgi:hypothetical protein
MGRSKRKRNSQANEQSKGFAQIPRVLLESEAYKAIKTLAAAKALPVFICKLSAAKARGEKPICEFTYGEAQKVHGIPRKSFARGVKELHKLGFLDIEHNGGVRKGSSWTSTVFRQSERWRRYNTAFFVEPTWAAPEPLNQSTPCRQKKIKTITAYG